MNTKTTENTNQILAKALEMERFGFDFFSLLEEQACDSESRLLFKQIAEEEGKHCDMFMLELELNGEPMADGSRGRVSGKLDQGVGRIVRKGPSMVFLYAIQVKQRINDFNRSSVDKVNSSWTRMLISDLIRHEEGHKLILSERLARIQAHSL